MIAFFEETVYYLLVVAFGAETGVFVLGFPVLDLVLF